MAWILYWIQQLLDSNHSNGNGIEEYLSGQAAILIRIGAGYDDSEMD